MIKEVKIVVFEIVRLVVEVVVHRVVFIGVGIGLLVVGIPARIPIVGRVVVNYRIVIKARFRKLYEMAHRLGIHIPVKGVLHSIFDAVEFHRDFRAGMTRFYCAACKRRRSAYGCRRGHAEKRAP